jgi:D-3-phosphoglycerate dehydrogenase
MNTPIIAVLDTGYENFEYEKDLFTSNGFQFRVFPGDNADREAKVDFARKATGLMIRWTEVDDDFLIQTPDLRAIVRYGAGYENIDLRAATASGVRVSNVTGYGNNAVSDHALALIYACARDLMTGTAEIRELFGKPPRDRIFELHRKTLGIIGLGRIGGTLATKAVHLFGEVIACDPYIPAERFDALRTRRVELDELLERSDVISLHCNLTGETTGMMDSAAFDKMKRIPVVINTARGPVIDAEALIGALDRGQIHSAGIDVFNTELPHELPEALLQHPRITATGHYAWFSENSHVDLQRKAADNMLGLLSGQVVEDCLNPDAHA